MDAVSRDIMIATGAKIPVYLTKNKSVFIHRGFFGLHARL